VAKIIYYLTSRLEMLCPIHLVHTKTMKLVDAWLCRLPLWKTTHCTTSL